MAENKRGVIVAIGLGKPKGGMASPPPKLGPGRPGKGVPPPPRRPQNDPRAMEPEHDPGAQDGCCFVCPNCGAPLRVAADGPQDDHNPEMDNSYEPEVA